MFGYPCLTNWDLGATPLVWLEQAFWMHAKGMCKPVIRKKISPAVYNFAGIARYNQILTKNLSDMVMGTLSSGNIHT